MPTIADPLAHARRCYADQPAVIDGAQRFTFQTLVERCERLVGALSSAGIDVGERVAILAGNCHQYIETYAGVPAGGRVVVPLNTVMRNRSCATR